MTVAALAAAADISNLAGLVLAPLAGVGGGLAGGMFAGSGTLARRLGVAIGLIGSVILANLAQGLTPASWAVGPLQLRYVVDPFLAGLAGSWAIVWLLRLYGTQVTHETATNLEPAGSPSGNLFVFVCYRRSDSIDTTGRLFDRLRASPHVGTVFRDIDSIPLGADFREHVAGTIAKCDVCLVVIGPSWLTVRDKSGRTRLMQPGDHVRQEVELILSSGANLIPVLVGGALMPEAEDLPVSLQPLAFKNAIPLRPDPDFHRDVDKLLDGMADLAGAAARRVA